jgi:hypothetical protein
VIDLLNSPFDETDDRTKVSVWVKPGAEMPLTPRDLDWSFVGKKRNWTERDVTWTKISTGETVTVRQHCLEKIDSDVSLEDLRKTADVRAAYPHLLALNSAPHMWVADLKQSEDKRADAAKQEEEFNTKKLPVECLVNSPIFCRVKVRAGAQTPLTPADLDWSSVGLENGWVERDIVWTKLSTGETMTCRQPLKKRTKIYTNSTIESLRKHPHILLSYHSIVLDDEVWVADL